MSFFPIIALLVTTFAQSSVELSIEDAVRQALQHSPRIRAAYEESRGSMIDAERRKPIGRPDVTAQAVGTLQGPRVTFPRGATGDATVFPEEFGRVELTVEQALFRAGYGEAKGLYNTQRSAADLQFQIAVGSVVYDVRKAFFQLLGAKKMLEVTSESTAQARAQVELIKQMLKSGTASERDLLAADADLAEAEQNVGKAENGIANAEANLLRLMGSQTRDHLIISEKYPNPALPAEWESLSTVAEKDHPQILLLKKQIESSQFGGKLAALQDRPTISARATAAAQTQTAFTDSHYFAGSLVFTWKPFDKWKTRLDVEQARSQSARLESLMEDAKSGIRLGVEKAWRDSKDALGRRELSERQVKSAAEALRVSRLRYEVGMATELEVSGALFALHRAESNRAQADLDILLASNELNFAVTGFVQKSVPGPLTIGRVK